MEGYQESAVGISPSSLFAKEGLGGRTTVNVSIEICCGLLLNGASAEKRAKISQLMQELYPKKFSAYEAKQALIKEIKKWEREGEKRAA